MILDLQQRLAGAVRSAAHKAFDIDLDTVSFQYPPRVELGDLALTAPFDLASQPVFLDQAQTLVEHARSLSARDLCRLMKISERLGILNAERFAAG